MLLEQLRCRVSVLFLDDVMNTNVWIVLLLASKYRVLLLTRIVCEICLMMHCRR